LENKQSKDSLVAVAGGAYLSTHSKIRDLFDAAATTAV
jgi:hypothetical protein